MQKARDKNIVFIDLRDRYGITQCVVDPARGAAEKALYETARKLDREVVLQVKGEVIERVNKNPDRATGDIEIVTTELTVLNSAKTPPFEIEVKTE